MGSDRRRHVNLYLRQAWRNARIRLVRWRMRLLPPAGGVPDRLLVAPTDLRSVDSFVSEEIQVGRFLLAGRALVTDGASPFSLELPSRNFAIKLHSFAWLRHFRAERTDAACAAARNVVLEWMAVHGRRIVGIAWEPDVIAMRIIAWLSHSPVVLQGAEAAFYRRFMKSLTYQIAYLEKIGPALEEGEVRLRVRIALAMASIAMPVRPAVVKRASRRLDSELEAQILPDGGHVSRNPRAGLNLLLDLLPLRQTYINLGHDVPQKLIAAIDRMYPALRFFRHQDGNLALFNGATSTLATELMSVLRYDETGGQPFKALPHTHYSRLSAQQTTIIMDTGMPLSAELSRAAHSGCLSFEMSSGRNRFIVNSGAPSFAGRKYQQLARATAAHSTVTLADTSSCRLSPSAFIGPVMVSGISSVKVRRHEDEDGNDRVTASHDGYAARFGFIHEREIEMDAVGIQIKGRDRFTSARGSAAGDPGLMATARFHIHPSIDLVQVDDEAVLLTAPDGESWYLHVPGQRPVIAEDIFFADSSGLSPSEQVEVQFPVDAAPEIRWILTRRS
ncbi:heparinase II/III family protein [Rhizobiaceae bacterium BDR2-2]|uniref:Heparinase II/III family protein n=1 Tax=Ectorhizobium quercum TaxID=2965071 RepID=A0AAE3N1Y9_9HYPH|nr:heparinase II/III family protein [Ectorhizobium quercum]MCX8999513.1 heparinase II/III family protein [Ectorhizobium quercum]